MKILQNKKLLPRTSGDTFLQHISCFELSTKLDIELVNGVAEYGSYFYVWHRIIMETNTLVGIASMSHEQLSDTLWSISPLYLDEDH